MKSLKPVVTVALGLALIVSVATSALADSYGGGWHDKNMNSASKEMGQHHMDGTVMKVNHHTGFITVKTHEGALVLHYPPKSIKDIKDGNKIRLYLGFAEITKAM